MDHEHDWVYENPMKILRVCSSCGVVQESYFAPFKDVRYWRIKERLDNPKELIESWDEKIMSIIKLEKRSHE